jgi:alpha-D-xyloside xylohydrolase
MSFFKTDGQKLIRRYDGETLWIEPWGKNGIRVRASQENAMLPEDWALLPKPETCSEISVSEDGEKACVVSGKLRAEVVAGGKITIYNEKGDVLLREYVRNGKNPEGFMSALDLDAREFRPFTGGACRLTARFESDPAEQLFGMGQYQQPYLDLKNCTLELAQRNSQASVPFLVSSLGYGFLWNNPGIGKVIFGKNLTEWMMESTRQLDYWVTAGDTPAEIEHAYAGVTGTVPMMPDYAMGFWQCKLRYQTQEELLEVARGYKKRGLPLSVIVIDYFHWTNQGDWKFDPDYWPDPDAMIRELKEMDVELMVSIWPTVDKTSENFQEMLEKGYLVRVDRGLRTTMEFLGSTVFYDATNPEARNFVWQKAKEHYYDKGVRLFWLDVAEPQYSVYDFDHYRYFIGSDLEVGNIYPLMYAKTFFDGMKATEKEGVINLLRCGWAGSQRYGALFWSGDIDSSFESLRNQFCAGLNMGLAGIPWWTTDIGGFHGGNIENLAFRECLVRWFEFGAFCPVFRLHGYREPFKAPLGTSGGGKCDSGADNEVWSYGSEVYEILEKYLFLRERLRPYIKGLMEQAHENGSPVIRTMFYEFPNDPVCWKLQDQYMFGPDILVAPVLYAGMRSREIYLPEGSSWKDARVGKTFEGGQFVTAEAPIDVIPVFLRNGADLPVWPEK